MVLRIGSVQGEWWCFPPPPWGGREPEDRWVSKGRGPSSELLKGTVEFTLNRKHSLSSSVVNSDLE